MFFHNPGLIQTWDLLATTFLNLNPNLSDLFFAIDKASKCVKISRWLCRTIFNKVDHKSCFAPFWWNKFEIWFFLKKKFSQKKTSIKQSINALLAISNGNSNTHALQILFYFKLYYQNCPKLSRKLLKMWIKTVEYSQKLNLDNSL